MDSSRRRFLVGGTCLLAPLAGCAEFGERDPTLVELEVELANGTGDPHAFHFAVETTGGLGEWTSREVPPGTRDSVVRDPPGDHDLVAIHGVVDDHPVSAELVGVGEGESGEVCPRVVFEYGLGPKPTILRGSDVRC